MKSPNISLTTESSSLVKSLPANQLLHIRFFIFCLGDRAYGDQFCAAGRKLIVRLRQLGAQMIGKPGYGDDGSSGGVLADLDEWMKSQLYPHCGSVQSNIPKWSSHLDQRYPAPYDVSFGVDYVQQQGMDEPLLEFIQRQAPLTVKDNVLTGYVVENRRLTAPDWHQDTRHIRIKVSAPYLAGDVAAIMPVNDSDSVERFLSVLPKSIQAVADKAMTVNFNGSAVSLSHPGVCYKHWPTQSTFRKWLRFCADFQALPEREDLRAVSRHCSQHHERGNNQTHRLRHMSDPEGAALYNDYILREKRSWIDLFHDFDSLRDDDSPLTIADILSLFSPLRTRDFSIASAPTVSFCEHLELCVALVKGTTRLQRKYKGLCSSYLASTTAASSEVRLWVRPGTFHPKELDCPMVCIAAGTGVAPMRSLLQERSINMITPSTLVFGCRSKSKDFYYHEEWQGLIDTGKIQMITAFSQDTSRKTYVQDVLENTDSIKKAFNQNCYVFIAGNPRMARNVMEKLTEILMEQTGVDGRMAKLILGQLQKSGKVSVEAW
jgi:sulfite reductase alpha subunit-like flavoprotein